MFDAHTHIQDPRLAPCRAAALAAASRAGVSGLCCCATAPHDWDAVASLVSDCPLIIPAWGVHPWQASSLPEGWEDRLDALLHAHPAAAVGECGLDGIRAEPSPDIQREVLRRQLDRAASRSRPVVLHGACVWGALLAAVKPFADRIPALVAHSFGGSRDILRDWLALGGFVSFSGTLCNLAATRVRAAAAATPADRLLIETDSPDLFPLGGVPCPGLADPAAAADTGPNHPANLSVVLHALAELRGVATDELAILTEANAHRAFGISRQPLKKTPCD
jgi:TatD DNase family protein